MISVLFSILSGIVSIFTILCFINIIISWFPGAKFTGFGKTIAAICDPYMNFFSKGGFLRFGNIDFSPILSIGILSVISSILGGITTTGRIYFGGIIATIVYMLWNVSSSLFSIFLILVFVRWLVLLINKGYTPYNSGWNNVDQFIQRFSYKIAGTFIKNRMSYLKSLLITWIVFLVLLGAGNYLIRILVALCYKIPF